MNPTNRHDADPERWLLIAEKEIGVAELAGPQSNPEVLKYYAATTLGGKPDDSVPWCSAFVNWVMQQAGYRGTRRANARSWLDWGQPCAPKVGSIVVLWRGSHDGTQGHVGFCADVLPGKVVLLGGNQGNRVCRQEYGFGRVLGARWPRVIDRAPSTSGSTR